MFELLARNAANIAVGAILLGLVSLVVRKMVKDRRAGASSCASGCAGCSGCPGMKIQQDAGTAGKPSA